MKNFLFNSSEMFDPHGNQIAIKRSRASKIKLSYNQYTGLFTLSIPNDYDIHAQHFIKRSHDWMLRQLSKPKQQSSVIHIKNHEKIYILGKEYKLLLKKDIKKSVVFHEDIIEVCCPPSQFLKVFESSLKDLIKKILYQRCFVYAQKMNVSFKAITVKETKTRWGSCSTKDNLNFSWRLIFMPSSVVDYLCVHEVAHLKEMNHSQNFWKIVEGYDPQYKEHQKWLKLHGKSLLFLELKS